MDNNAAASASAIGVYASSDHHGAPAYDPTIATSLSSGGSYGYGQGQERSAEYSYGYSNGGACTRVSADGSGGADAGDGIPLASKRLDQGVDGGDGASSGDVTAAAVAANAAADASAYSWPADPEGMLTVLQQQRQQYRSWVAQCASTALAALDPSHGSTAPYESSYCSGGGSAPGIAEPFAAGAIPDDVLGLVEAMDAAGSLRQYLLLLKAAAESVRDAARAGANFEALSLPVGEVYDGSSDAAAGEAAEAEFVSAAYGVTSAIATARGLMHQLTQLGQDPAAALVQEVLSQQQGPNEAAAVAEPGVAADAEGTAAGASAAVAAGRGGLLLAPLTSKMERVGAGLCRRLRQEAEGLMSKVQWPPPLADGGGGAGGGLGSAAPGVAGPGSGAEGGLRPVGVAPVAGPSGSSASASEDALFRGFEQHPLQARRLAGVLTALTHYQMAVEQRTEFYQLLAGGTQGSETKAVSGGDGGGDAAAGENVVGSGAKPLLWAAQVLAEPVAAKLRAHFHPAAPTGRLDRPAWLYCTVLEFVRQHGHALASLDDMLACLQLKPHYNMPAEFARAMQDAVVALLRDLRIPLLLELRNQVEGSSEGGNGSAEAETANSAAATEAEADALLLGLMDASAAYDIAMLPLLGATGPRVEAEAARGMAMLSAAAAAGGAVLQRRRACDQFDPTAVGTADMHARYVGVAAGAGPAAAAEAARKASLEAMPPAALPSLLQAWAAAEGGAALRAVEAVVYDESSLAPAEEAAARALGAGLSPLEDEPLSSAPATSFSAAASSGLRMGGGPNGGLSAGSFTGGGGGGGGSSFIGGVAPWQRDTWPPVLAREAAALLDGLVARSKWLSANPVRQREFLEAAAGPMLALLRRRLSRVLDQAVSRGEVVSEEGLPKVCAALCAAHFLYDHLQSLLLTDLAPLVQALHAAAPPLPPAGDAGEAASGAATPLSATAGVPAGKLGAGGGGFWSGLIAAAACGGGVPSSPARVALRDGVTALAAGTGGVFGAAAATAAAGAAAPSPPVLGEHVGSFCRLHRDGCLKVARELALGFGRCSVAYRHAIEANPQFPFTPESDAEEADDGVGGSQTATAATATVVVGSGQVLVAGNGSSFDMSRPASSITPSFAPALLFLQCSLERLSRCCDKATFFDVWRGAALSINRFMFNFIATESRFTRAGARQFAADVAGLAQLFTPYSRRGGGGAATRPGSFSSAATATTTAVGGSGGAGNQHFRELQAAARLLCMGDEDTADVMRRASAAAVAAAAATSLPPPQPHSLQTQSLVQSEAQSPPPQPKAQPPSSQGHVRGDPVRSGMSSDPVLSSAGLACLSPLQIMNVIEHRI